MKHPFIPRRLEIGCLLYTSLVIAHRMRTVEAADKIVVLADGQVAEEGSPAELMEHNGLYRRCLLYTS